LTACLASAAIGCGESSSRCVPDAADCASSAPDVAQAALAPRSRDRDASGPGRGHRPQRAPNVLLIMADDLGYSDVGALGGEIETPNLDELVGDGRILTNHHVGTVSAITRSMLISGTDHHLVGEGTMGAPSDERRGLPGYEGYLNDSALSIAELLQDAGYHTYMAGKWHLGSDVPGVSSGQGRTPDQWGFERSFALLGGAAGNHFGHQAAGSKAYSEDGAYVQPGQPGQPGGEGGTPAVFYSTDFYTQKLIEYIDSHRGDGKPFFAYAAYTSPHWPLQVPEPWLSKYRGKYDAGYGAIRAARIARLRRLGLFHGWASAEAPETLTISPASSADGTADAKYISAVHSPEDGYVDYHAGVIDKAWQSLSDEEKRAQARYMEIYAGMVSNLDHNIGLLIQHLKDIGEYDDTFIVFHSDNGAEGWPISSDPKTTDEGNAAAGVFETLGTDNGQPNAQRLQYGLRWAEVSATPLAQWKGFLGEGGFSTAAIVKLPAQRSPLPPFRRFTHVTDDTATILAIARVTPPTEPAPELIDANGRNVNAGKVVYKERYVYPITGHSLLPALTTLGEAPVWTTSFGEESYGRAAIYSADGQWKARWTEPPFGPADGHWELFHIAIDRGERFDRSAEHPELVRELFDGFQGYLERVGGVEPLRPKGYY
jgi:arylsulfatase